MTAKIDNSSKSHESHDSQAMVALSDSANGPVDKLADGNEARQEATHVPSDNAKPTTIISGDRPAAKTGHTRHMIALLALSAVVLANMNRQAYNQALVRMIRRPKSPTTQLNNVDTLNDPIEPNAISDNSSKVMSSIQSDFEAHSSRVGEQDAEIVSGDAHDDAEEGFDWSGSQISLLQAGFSYGYVFFMIPGGRLSEIYGAKWVIFLSSFGSALCSLMTPFLANRSYALLVASRIFMGLCQTGISPALYALLARWLPPNESSVYLPMIKVGVMIGFMSGSLVNGFLPWQLMFYIIGMIGILWSIGWTLIASSLPGEHKFMGQAEKDYIRQCLERHAGANKKQVAKSGGDDESKEKVSSGSKSAPWFRILKNPSVLAFTFTKFTVKMSTDTQTMQIPMYLRNVFQISDQLNGILNGTNFAIQALFTGVVAYTAKEMVVREQFGLHKTGIRRLFQAINCFGMSLAYLLITFNMGSLNLVCCAVITLSITSMFGSGGEAVLPIDLTTEYAASIMAIANSLANLSGIALPPIVSFFLDNQLTNSNRWNYVWWFISATMACGGLVFSLVVKAKIQSFNDGNKRKVKTSPEDNPFGQPHHVKGVQPNGSVPPPQVSIEINLQRTSPM